MDQSEYIREMAARRGVPIIRELSHEKLAEVTKRINPKTILEIGTAVGYSGIIMLSNAPDSELVTVEHDDYKVTEAKENFKKLGLEKRATCVLDDCNVFVSNLVAEGEHDNYFDLIFLDGPKAQYIKMLDGLVMLCKHGGTILVDNVLFRGFVRGDKSQMPKRYRTIVKRLEMFLDRVETHPDIKEFKLYELEDGMLEITVK